MGNKINTLIGSDISIIGDIFYEGTVHVEASIEGSLIAHKDKNSKLFINKGFIFLIKPFCYISDYYNFGISNHFASGKFCFK